MAPRWAYRLRYFVTDAWEECRHSPGVNLLAAGTLAATLFLAGLVVLVLSNVERRIDASLRDVRLHVFLDDAAPPAGVAVLRGELAGLSGVEAVEHVDKEQALARYREFRADLAELIPELGANPLPASLEVVLAPGHGRASAERIVERLAGRAGIEEVRFDGQELALWERRLELVQWTAGGLALLVFGAVVLIVASVLRLAVFTRRDEIGIMQLVGATATFIRGPFLVAGVAHGLVAAILAGAAVEALRQLAMVSAGGGAEALVELVAAHPIPVGRAALLALVGVLVSLAGAWFAVKPAD